MSRSNSFRRIRMTLARTPGFPDGSMRHGYEFIAPLDESGKIDVTAWRANRGLCTVHRFWGNEEEVGHLVHHGGGKSGSWAFHYDIDPLEGPDIDEAGYRFGEHAFKVGEYVSVKDEEGDLRTFQVVTIGPV